MLSEALQHHLNEIGCRQLLRVTADRFPADIRWYERRCGRWRERRSLCANGTVGRNGVRDDKREGDGCTPRGLFPIGDAFYSGKPIRTGLDAFPVTDRTCWVDDPNSAFYNRRAEDGGGRDWQSAERMSAFAEYVCGFVIEHNPTCDPQKGSAVFFHVLSEPSARFLPTSGCVAVSEPMVRVYLRHLKKEQHPHILIE